MALKARSMILFGLEVRADNQNLPFRNATLGPQINAVIPAGFYSLTSLAVAIAGAMHVADPTRTYTITVDRTVAGGTENRITIATSGSHLELLFATGTTAASSIRDLISFGIFDYTGSTTYTNGATSGTPIVTEWFGNNYQPPEIFKKNFGSVNVATSGKKETITWTIQKFIGVEFKYEPEAKALSDWSLFIDWAIQQKPFDFTPEILFPNVVYDVTLEKTPDDGKGLGWTMKEQLPDFPFRYTTGPFVMRVGT